MRRRSIIPFTACAASWAILGLAHAPWRDLGGLVSERLRWLESFAVGCGVILGYTSAAVARYRGLDPSRALRVALYPAGLLVAATLLLLEARMANDLAALVFNAFLGHAAGVFTGMAGGSAPTGPAVTRGVDGAMDREGD